MSVLNRLWCWLTCHSWQLHFMVDAAPAHQEAFRQANLEISCTRCGGRVPARIERRDDVLIAVPAYWPDSRIIPDWMIEGLR